MNLNRTFMKFTLASNVLLYCMQSCLVFSSRIQINNNAYENIVVAISSSIDQTEGEKLIPKIQDLFTNASQSLYTATNQRAYFQNVRIVVPHHWEHKKEYDRTIFENFNDADVKIEKNNPVNGDGPFTLQTMPCGYPGEYIHLTAEYLEHLSERSTELFGDPGKTLVHEWAHLRYGIFNEHGDRTRFPVLYFNEDYELVPNACSNSKLIGSIKDALTDGSCNFVKGYPDSTCIFDPNMNENDANSSLASFHFLPQVSYFCDDTDVHKHDPKIPNKHNLLCNSRSTWNVIMDNEDFKNRNPPRDISNIEPKFRIVQPQSATICLLLDASMEEAKLKNLKDAITLWLQLEVPGETEVGIITFGDTIARLKDFTRIDEANRKDIIDKVKEIKNDGTTAKIGDGIQAATNMVDGHKTGNQGIIVLITDGKKDGGTVSIDDALVAVKEKQIRVNTIALSKEADSKINRLADESGGKAYFVPATHDVQLMENYLTEIVSHEAAHREQRNIQIYQNNFDKKTIVNDTFIIDSTVGNDTIVTVDISPALFDSLKFDGPGIPTTGAVKYKTFEGESAIYFQLQETLQPGNYTFNIQLKQPTQVTVTLTSKTSSSKAPITTQCWIKIEEVKSKSRYIIFAKVNQGNKPIINADVTANVYRPDGTTVDIKLYDNGQSPDITLNDGIYSSYFRKFAGKGRYLVQVTATNDGTASVIDMAASNAMPIVNKYTASITQKSSPAEMFQRYATADEMNVKDNYASDETFQPRRIIDLEVVNVTESSNYSAVSLQWTAPGANHDEGNASRYEMRYSNNWNALFYEFENNATEFLLDTVPSPVGTTESVEVKIHGLKEKITYYIALRTHNKNDKVSEISNIVFAQVIVEDDDQLIPIIVGAVLGALFVIFLVAAAISKFKNNEE